MHSVDICFVEERCWRCDDGGKMDVLSTTDLTFVTSPDEPFDIVRKMRPPKTFEESKSNCVDAFVSKFVVRGSNEIVASIGGRN